MCECRDRRGAGNAARARLDGRLSVFCGNSGVGKSTLLSALLPGHELETGEISQKLGRGRHTTREVVLYESCGGLVADTPGFASLEMERAAAHSERKPAVCVSRGGALLRRMSIYRRVLHTVEKGCAVRAALEAGEIDKTRYESYVTLYNEAKEVKEWQM